MNTCTYDIKGVMFFFVLNWCIIDDRELLYFTKVMIV